MPLGAIMNTSTLALAFDDEFNSFSASPNGATGLWQTTLANGNWTLGSNGEEEYYSDNSVVHCQRQDDVPLPHHGLIPAERQNREKNQLQSCPGDWSQTLRLRKHDVRRRVGP